MQPTQKLQQKTIEEMLDVHPDLLATNILVQHLPRHPRLLLRVTSFGNAG
jgi:hypothetical protein